MKSCRLSSVRMMRNLHDVDRPISIEKEHNKKTGKGGNLLFGSFLPTPKIVNKYWADIYAYIIYIIIIIILCVKYPRKS